MFAGAQTILPPYVELIWEDGAIAETWLEVQVLPTAATGLASPHTFYFGNKIGDTGNPTETQFVTTVAGDVATIQLGIGAALGITDVRDIDRSGVITASQDRSVAIANLGTIVRLNLEPDEELADDDELVGDGSMGSALAATLHSQPGRRRRPVPAASGDNPTPRIARDNLVQGDAARWQLLAPGIDDDPASVNDELEQLLDQLARGRRGES
jgi:hypothetical protein